MTTTNKHRGEAGAWAAEHVVNDPRTRSYEEMIESLATLLAEREEKGYARAVKWLRTHGNHVLVHGDEDPEVLSDIADALEAAAKERAGDPQGTFACPVWGCDQDTSHAHSAEVAADLQADRLFLASDGPLTQRAYDAARLLRRDLEIARRTGTDPPETVIGRGGTVLCRIQPSAAWSKVCMSKQNLFAELSEAAAKERDK